ncbi:hypothetical protein LCGC14_1011590 [marine sediment metagenome]|uniref:LamG-like jellyroll fold domain-containing protein n=1 Tax=marine sediment metagenome TaxID=412755 RepID=A0A0F9N4M5_9ZZZZ
MNLKILIPTIAVFLLAVYIVFALVPTQDRPTLAEVDGGLTGTNQSGAGGTKPIIFNWNFHFLDNLNASRWLNEPTLISFWPLDQNNASDIVGNNDGSKVNSAVGVSNCKVEGCFDIERGTNDYLSVAPVGMGFSSSDPITECAWIKPETLFEQMGILSVGSANPGGTEFSITASGKLVFGPIGTGTTRTSSDIVVINKWQYVCIVHEGGETSSSKTHFYYNTIEQASDGATFTPAYNSGDSRIGRTIDSTFDGLIDEVILFKRNLSRNEIIILYNAGKNGTMRINESDYSGTIGDYQFETFACDTVDGCSTGLNDTGPVITTDFKEFTLTADDTYDGVSINNFTVTIDNGSFSFNDSTENGSLHIFNSTVPSFNVTYNITFRSNESGGYFNRTFLINLTNGGSFVTDIFQAIARINISEAVSGIKINDFNVSVPLQVNKSNSSGFATLFLRAGDYNISINSDDHLTTGGSFTVGNLDDKFFNFTMGTANLTITAISGGSSINDFNTSITLLSTGFTETKETNIGKVIFLTIPGTYNITMNSTDFAFASQTITIVTGNILPNITFNLFSTNSINISIFDEELNELIDSITVTLILDHENQRFTNTTDSGLTFLTGLFDGLWNLLASTIFHDQREYIFTIVPQTSTSLNIYLLNSSNGETKTFTVKNKQDQTLPDSTVSISNKINNTFVAIAQSVTNFAGQVNIFLSSTNKYRFTVEAPGFTTKVFDLVPVVDSYNIIMDPIDSIDFTTEFDRVNFATFPVSHIITPQENQNFSIITSSEVGLISYFGLNSSFNSTENIITNVSGSVAGGTATILINTSLFNATTIGVDFFIKLSGEDEIRFHRDFRTSVFITPGNHSIVSFADKYKDRFSDVFKSLLVVIAAVAVIISLAEMGSPAVINGVVGVVIIIGGAIVGWIPTTTAFIVGFITIGMFLLRRGD